MKFGIVKLLPGLRVNAYLTFKCNYDCSYCTHKILGKRPVCKTVELNDWIIFFETFPYKIKEVTITGGEPTLMPYCTGLANYLLNQGYFVTIITNLSHPEVLFKIGNSYRLRINATYHYGQISQTIFMKYVYFLRMNDYRLDIDEISEKRLPIKTNVKKFDTIENMDDPRLNKRLQIAPDLSIHNTCYQIIKFYEKAY